MVDFILKKSDYELLPEHLLRSVPGFEESEEFQIVEADRELPSVVCGALAQYLVTVQRRTMKNEEACPELERILSATFEIIEDLATSEHLETQNAVVIDILESLASEVDLMEVIKRSLLPRSRELYDRWIAPKS